jgi:energy-coupling factor transporter ATP-binding protein EcfA2
LPDHGALAMLLRGSEWKRWDLHIHTPETALNDQFGSWEEYLTAIEANSEVKVVGVTDYMTITNYSKLMAAKRKGRIANIELLVPNIEFRIAPPSDKATAINIHLLISPDFPDHEGEIQNALGRLTWRYGQRNYSCLPEQLMTLGRTFDPTIVDDRAALATGVTQFKVDFTKLREWFESEPWLQRNSLIAVAAGDDGLSAFQRDGAWGGYREEITRFSQILLSGRPGEREFWIGRRSTTDRETVMRLGGFKPCLHGSDAHSIAKLFRPDQDRYCWIKADTTFEGLKQVLYEPEDRAYIGPTPPLYHDQARVIRSVRLADSDGWFDNTEIPLNAGLVSIIGQKGSGKSALAEVIAYTAGSWVTDEPGSFLKRAGAHLKNMAVELVWGDDTVSRARLDEKQSNESEVRYLSQKFVERLCADDHIGAELVHEIEAVVFSYIDPTDTLNASSFDELRAIRTEGFRDEGNLLRAEIIRLIREECALRDNAAKLVDKIARIKTLAEERAGLVKQLPIALSAQEAKIQADLQGKRQALAIVQQAVAIEKQRLQKVADVRMRVTAFRSQIARFYAEIEPMLIDVGLAEADRATFRPAFPTDPEPVLARREAVVKRFIAQQEGKSEDPAENTIRWFQAQIEALMKRETADKVQQERIKVIQTRVAAIDTEVTRIQDEITHIEGPEKQRIAAARRERSETYVAFFTNLRREQQTLEVLYEPVSQRLMSEATSAQEQELEFSIRWEVDLTKWLGRGGALFDQRKAIPYGTIQGLEDAARKILAPSWTSGDPAQVEPALEQFLSEFRSPKLPPAKYLRTGVSVQDVFEWIYEVEHVRLSYGLKYNGVELEKLSPGTKGIVLLILYLGMDIADTRPLIVDQPDENLDNESIYNMLTAYFKSAKTRRQIVLITHNPNMVVNADSEQVIVATVSRRETGLPHIMYCSGALEDNVPPSDGIRQQVCRILEGGSDAFRKRERRYDLG